MIFLSAQPDTYYFLWQLKLQLFNFNRLGINSKDIHVLICYNKEKGLSNYFQDFIKENNKVQIFAYPDNRKSRLYDSSLRPHIITKHFKANPWLEKETIFYHDSDIIFTRLPDFNMLSKNDIWWASDTRSYTDSHYIRYNIGNTGFDGMARIIGMKTSKIKQYDENMGGAQYVLKNVSINFWKRLEIHCEKMYKYLNSVNNKTGEKKIQAWCTDMWCLWWQAIKIGKNVKIHSELDFMWANTPILNQELVNILHYTGNFEETETRYFRKNNYSRCTPFFADFLSIDNNSASKLLIEEIKKYNKNQLRKRFDLSDVSFLIPIRIDSEERLENLRIITNYLSLHFKTNIIVLEADNIQKVDLLKLPKGIEYHFIIDDNVLFHRTKYNNHLITLSKTSFVALYDTDVILPINAFLKSIQKLKNGLVDVVYPYDGSFISVDMLTRAMFAKLLDVEMLEVNKGKQYIATKRSYGGCVILNKQVFLSIGGENENLTSWGPDDVERKKRMQIFGIKTYRIRGNLYHLPHPRSDNSGYKDLQQRVKLMNEYFKICKMKPEDLKNYINTWPWKQKLDTI